MPLFLKIVNHICIKMYMYICTCFNSFWQITFFSVNGKYGKDIFSVPFISFPKKHYKVSYTTSQTNENVTKIQRPIYVVQNYLHPVMNILFTTFIIISMLISVMCIHACTNIMMSSTTLVCGIRKVISSYYGYARVAFVGFLRLLLFSQIWKWKGLTCTFYVLASKISWWKRHSSVPKHDTCM